MGNDQSSPASCPHKTNPLMDVSQRNKCLQIFNDHFKTNENFLRDSVLLKLRMKGKLLKVRDKIIMKRQQSNNSESESSENSLSAHSSAGGTSSSSDPSSPGTQALFAAAPVPSFANFEDAHSIQHKPTREEKIRDGINLLKERIQNFHVQMEVMADDGNCQFRAIAHQLYNGDQDGWHGKVRETVVAYMHKNAAEFSFLFEDEKEFNRYLGGMARNRTWGDELTLKAACNAYNVVIHVLTSEKEHYYVCYKPDSMLNNVTPPPSSSTSKDTTAGSAGGDAKKENENQQQQQQQPMDIFLAYISPIHYNSIRVVS